MKYCNETTIEVSVNRGGSKSLVNNVQCEKAPQVTLTLLAFLSMFCWVKIKNSFRKFISISIGTKGNVEAVQE